MKDCKWNPPTSGSKGQLFLSDGTRVSRDQLKHIPDGTILLKFFDDRASKSDRRRAEKEFTQWRDNVLLKGYNYGRLPHSETERANLAKTYLKEAWRPTGRSREVVEGALRPPAGWAVHVRDSVVDKVEDITEVDLIADILGAPRPRSASKPVVDQATREALAEIIAVHRLGKVVHLSALATVKSLTESQAAASGLDMERFLSRFSSARAVLASTTPGRQDTSAAAAAVMALRAKWLLDTLDPSSPADRDILLMFSHNDYDAGYPDQNPSVVDADVLLAVEPIFNSNWRTIADEILKRRAESESRNVAEPHKVTPYNRYFATLNQISQLEKEHDVATPAELSRYFGSPAAAAHALFDKVGGGLASQRSLLLAVDLLSLEDGDRDFRPRLPDDLPHKDYERLMELTKRLERGHRAGRISGTNLKVAEAYLSDPENARPYLDTRREAPASAAPPAGFINAPELNLSRMEVPSEVVKAVNGLPVHKRTAWDGVQLSPKPSSQELVCTAVLATARAAAADNSMTGLRLSEEAEQLADRIASRSSLADLARSIASEAKNDGVLSSGLLASLAASGISHRLSVDVFQHSLDGVEEFSGACQGLLTTGHFVLPERATPPSYKAGLRLCKEVAGDYRYSDSAHIRRRLEDARSVPDIADVLLEEEALARMRVLAGIGVEAAPYLRSRSGDLSASRAAVAVAPGVDAVSLTDAVKAALPSLASHVKRRDQEVLIDAPLDDPLGTLEALQTALSTIR